MKVAHAISEGNWMSRKPASIRSIASRWSNYMIRARVPQTTVVHSKAGGRGRSPQASSRITQQRSCMTLSSTSSSTWHIVEACLVLH